jgi:serine/threonine protein phosphatase 1
MSDCVYYGIGDVHGEVQKLLALHDIILADHDSHGGQSVVVHLGDYVDRGYDSAGVIDAVMAFEQRAAARRDIGCVSLKGNHEQMMIDALVSAKPSSERHWAFNGGEETLESYARRFEQEPDDWLDMIPRAHIDWLKRLQTLYHDPERRLAFVHGGIDPETFPLYDDMVRMWTRAEKFFHTETWPRRRELAGLTAAVLAPGAALRFLQA